MDRVVWSSLGYRTPRALPRLFARNLVDHLCVLPTN